MKRDEALALKEAFVFFADGGELYAMNDRGQWFSQGEFKISSLNEPYNIIGDKHLEARKLHATGHPLEGRCLPEINCADHEWSDQPDPTWDYCIEYREKKPIVYEWQWYNKHVIPYVLTDEYFADRELDSQWKKFEPSKRIRQ